MNDFVTRFIPIGEVPFNINELTINEVPWSCRPSSALYSRRALSQRFHRVLYPIHVMTDSVSFPSVKRVNLQRSSSFVDMAGLSDVTAIKC